MPCNIPTYSTHHGTPSLNGVMTKMKKKKSTKHQQQFFVTVGNIKYSIHHTDNITGGGSASQNSWKRGILITRADKIDFRSHGSNACLTRELLRLRPLNVVGATPTKQ